eukprot:220218_1
MHKTNRSITIYHIILLQLGSAFNYLQSKSYKIYSGYIHSDLGISYTTLTYTVFVAGYISIPNLIMSKYYNRIPNNVFMAIIFGCASLSACLIYSLYEYTFILFIARPLLSFSTLIMWNYVLSMLANFVDDTQRRNVYIALWNTTYPLSTFFLVIAGVIIHHLSYFDYLLMSAIVAACTSVLCLCVLPSPSIYSLSTENKNMIDAQLKQSVVSNVFNLCTNNKLFICMMCCSAMDAMLLSIMNLFIGPYLKDTYGLNPQQLGIYVTTSIGAGELFTSLVVIPWIADQSRFHIFVVIGAMIQCIAFAAWNVLHNAFTITNVPFSVMLVMVSFVYLGHELLFCGIMFKNQYVAHQSEQTMLVSIWIVIMTIFGSMGNMIVGELYGTEKGTRMLLVLLVVLSGGSLFGGSALWYLVNKQHKKEEYMQAKEADEIDMHSETIKLND